MSRSRRPPSRTVRSAPVPAPSPRFDEAAASRAAVILAIGAATLAVLRLVAPLVPWTGAWSLQLARYTPFGIGWALAALAALAAWPPVARRLVPAWRLAGDSLGRQALAPLGLAAATALLLWFLPDQTWFVGDFLVRRGAAAGNVSTEMLFPQALPFDLFLHHTLPGLAGSLLGVEPPDVERALGALEGGILALLAVRFARTLGWRGVAASAGIAVALAGGALGLFTGYGKAFREMALLAAAVATFGVSLVREGRGALGLGWALATGFAVHRSALALLLPGALAWAAALRRPGGARLLRDPAALGGLALPALTLAATLPRMIAAMQRFDTLHLAPTGSGLGAVLGAAFASPRPLDFANVVLQLAPLAPAALVAAIVLGRGALRRAEAWVLIALLLPFVLALLFVHPRQGLFRDWDDFAALGTASSFAAAWVLGETLAAAPARAWVGVAAAVGTLAPTLLGLIHVRAVDPAIARIEAVMAGAPPRPEMERALAFDFVGSRSYALGRLDRTADSYERAAAIAQTPRFLLQWAMAERDRGRPGRAREVLERLIAKAPDMPHAWATLAAVAMDQGDRVTARAAATKALELSPGFPDMEALLAELAAAAPADTARAPR